MTDDELDRIEAWLAIQLPTEYRRFAADYPHNADADMRAHGIYDRAESVISQTEMLRSQGLPEQPWRYSYIAIGDSGCGDYYFLDLGESPAPVKCWNHETSDTELVAMSIDEWSARLLGLPLRYISKAEAHLCKYLRPILAGLPLRATIEHSDDFREVLLALQFFLPELLEEVHREWGEGLDGVYAARAQKTGNREIEIIGLCCLISDQTLTPMHLRLQIAANADYVCWTDCRFGERTAHGMRREPYRNSAVNGSMLHVLERIDSIDWCYHVGYGERTG